MNSSSDADDQTRALKKRCRICSSELDHALDKCPYDGGVLDSILEPGAQLVAAYSYDATLGKGGMGIIYKAHHQVLDRTVAIKMLTASRLSEEDIHRFQREGKAIGKLHHPNIIHVFEFGVTPEGYPFMVMDFVEGLSLAQLLKQCGKLTRKEAFSITDQIGSAMEHAHNVGVVHRDLKPSNIMLEKKDDGSYLVKVVDFGIAKILQKEENDTTYTQTGEIFGSPKYMSPEQAQGRRADHRSDIYSLACILYEMLTGRAPFIAESAMELVFKQISEEPKRLSEVAPNLEFPDCLEFIVAKALEKDPVRRFNTCEAFRKALEDCSMGTFTYTQVKRRNRIPIWIHVSAVIIGIISFGIFIGSPHLVRGLISDNNSETKEQSETANNLRPTKLEGYQVSPLTIAALSKTKRLKALSLVDVKDANGKIAKDSLTSLNQLTRLTNLQLINCGLEDKDIKLVGDLKQLKDLDLSGNPLLTDRAIDCLNQYPQLENLNLSHNQSFHLASLLKLHRLPDLQTLKVDGVQIDPDAVARLVSKATSLEVLSLRATALTDQLLAELSKLKNLSELDVRGCGRLTHEGVVAFQKLASGCVIQTDQK